MSTIPEAPPVAQYDDARHDEDERHGDDDDGGKAKKISVATQLMRMALDEGIAMWRTPADEVHATLPSGEHMPIGDRRLAGWLRRLWYVKARQALPAQALTDARGGLEAQAWADDAEIHEAHLRVAGDEHAIYLAVDPQHVVQVTADGWRVIDDAPVRLVSRAGSLPLPTPVRGGSLDDLREIHPALTDDEVWALTTSWLVGAARPWGSYAILALIGEHGTGKSWLGRLLLSICDPTEAGLRSPPRDARDLAAAVRGSRVVALDNVGHVQPWLSDALCVTATGGTFAARTLYTDADEHLVRARQPVIVTAIDDVVRAGDLRDRSLIVRVPPLADRVRRTDAEVAAMLEQARPRIFGGLLDCLARGLARHADVTDAAAAHRLADHVRWAVACEPAPNALIRAAHRDQRAAAASEQVDDPMGRALIALAEDGWDGAVADLLAEVGRRVPESDRPHRGWPGSPRAMGSALRRRAPALRRLGYDVVEGDGYGPRRNCRGVSLSGGSGTTSDTSDTSEASGTVEYLVPDVAHVPDPTSGNVGPKPSNDYAVSDVADVADAAPGPSQGARERGWV